MEDLRSEIHSRFDRLEEKLEKYTVETATLKADVAWVKGYMKTGAAALVSVITAMIAQLFHLKV